LRTPLKFCVPEVSYPFRLALSLFAGTKSTPVDPGPPISNPNYRNQILAIKPFHASGL